MCLCILWTYFFKIVPGFRATIGLCAIKRYHLDKQFEKYTLCHVDLFNVNRILNVTRRPYNAISINTCLQNRYVNYPQAGDCISTISVGDITALSLFAESLRPRCQNEERYQTWLSCNKFQLQHKTDTINSHFRLPQDMPGKIVKLSK